MLPQLDNEIMYDKTIPGKTAKLVLKTKAEEWSPLY